MLDLNINEAELPFRRPFQTEIQADNIALRHQLIVRTEKPKRLVLNRIDQCVGLAVANVIVLALSANHC